MGVWCIYLQNNGLILQKRPVLSSNEHINRKKGKQLISNWLIRNVNVKWIMVSIVQVRYYITKITQEG